MKIKLSPVEALWRRHLTLRLNIRISALLQDSHIFTLWRQRETISECCLQIEAQKALFTRGIILTMTMAKTRINVDSFAYTRSDVLNYVNKSPLPCVWRATSFSILREEAHPPHPLSIITTGTYQRENSSHMCPERHNYLLDWPPLLSHHQVPGPQAYVAGHVSAC